MASTINLFASETVDHYVDNHRAYITRDVQRIKTIDELEAETDRIIDRAPIKHCTLERARATFDISELADKITVQLVIPIEGNARLLYLQAAHGTSAGPYATIEEGRFLSKKEPGITLSAEFPAGTNADTVRAWGKEQADTVSKLLDAIRPTIDAYNETAEEFARRAIAERRDVLDTATGLRGDLGTGI